MRESIKETLRRIGLGVLYLVPITLAVGAIIYVLFLHPASVFIIAFLVLAWMVGDMVESSNSHKRYMKEFSEQIRKDKEWIEEGIKSKASRKESRP